MLAFQHLQVFREDFALPLADLGGERFVLRLELARHAPEVPHAGVGLGGDEVHHDAVDLVAVGRVVAAVAGVGHTHLDHDLARRGEAADLPAVHRHVVGQAVAAQRGAPKRWRRDVVHEAAGDHLVATGDGLAGGFVDFGLADAAGVHIGFVRQVHQVVDHEAVIGLDVVEPTAKGPVGVVVPVLVGNGGGVGLGGVTGPDPDKAVALHRRVGADGRKAADALAGHGHGLAVATHHQAVVAAHELAFADAAQRQRRAAVRAKVFERGHAAVGLAVEHQLLVADGAAQRLIAEFVRLRGDVPGVDRESGHGRS